MTVLQLNPVGMVSTDVGYISSITVRYNGANNVLTPDGSNQITLPNATTGARAARNAFLAARVELLVHEEPTSHWYTQSLNFLLRECDLGRESQ